MKQELKGEYAMSNKLIKRAGSVALATAMTVTMLPTGSLSFASTNVDVDVTQVAATQGSGVNLPLTKNSTPSGICNTSHFDASYDAKYKYDGNDLGCVYTKDSTTFKVWAPDASDVTLCRYATGSDGEAGAKSLGETKMTKENGVWSVTIDGDIVNTYYTFKVTNNGKTEETVDIYAKALGVNGKRAMVVDLDSTNPANWDKDYKREPQQLSDMVTWEIDVNDFSEYGTGAGFSEKNKGKYLAFTEDGTKLSGTDYDTGIAYLKKLGVTHVQILPIYDFGSVDETKPIADENYNWGYDPANFNAPEGSYSTNPYDGNVRINELKQMIQALHDAGIKVIMDVVYNHTFVPDKPQDFMAYSPYDKFVPGYYYRTYANGKKTDGSGCGNSVRTEAYMANKFIRESMLYWADEYNLDGFRLDLMGLYDNNTMKDIRADMDKNFGTDTILIYGEGWTGNDDLFNYTAAKGDEGLNAEAKNRAGKWSAQELADAHIGFFNDTGRDCIHGLANGEGEERKEIGMLQQNIASTPTNGQKYPLGIFGMIQGATGKSKGEYGHWRAYFAGNSNQTVTYDSCHDNKTLWDKLAETISDENMRVKLNKMDAGLLLTSHGGAFLHAGEEICRSKNGTENSYNKGTTINKIDWSNVKKYNDSFEYFKGMIGVRKAFSGFRNEYTTKGSVIPENDPNGGFREVGNSNLTNINNFTSCSGSNIHSIGYYLSNNVSGEWNQVAVLINNDNADKTATLSASDGSTAWVLVSNGSKASVKGVETVNSNSIKVPGKSVVVAVPKKTFDANPDVGKEKTSITLKTSETSIETTPGQAVSFTATATGAEKITLSAANLPEGAKFDAATGKFTWDKAVAGTYSVSITATDGTNKTSKTVTIKVVSATTGLSDLIATVEAAKLKEADYETESWKALQTALTNAKAVVAKSDATDAEISTAKNALQKAYDALVAQKKAKDALTEAVSKAGTTIVEAKANTANTAEILADASEVLQAAEALLKTGGTAVAYQAAIDNLDDSVKSLATGSGKGSITVSSAPFSEVYAYAWTEVSGKANELLGAWPGKAMTKNADGTYSISTDGVIDGDAKFNLIINAGKSAGKQTDTMSDVSGVVTVKLDSNSSGKDTNGNDLYKATKECKAAGSAEAPAVFNDGLKAALTNAESYKAEDYTKETYAKLTEAVAAAKAVAENKSATQLEINKAARTVRAAYVALVAVVKEEPVSTAAPTATPDANAPTAAPGEITPTPTTSGTATPEPTVAPISSLKIADVLVSPEKKVTVGKKVTVYTSVTGATGTAKYKYNVYLGSATTPTYTSEYSAKDEYSFTPKKVGTYTIEVLATDDTGVTQSKKVSYKVVAKALSVKVTAKGLKVKKNTKISVTVSGGVKSYKYKYVIKNAKGKKVKSKAYSSSKTLTWKATEKGKYKITVTVKDAQKKTKTVTKTVTVK